MEGADASPPEVEETVETEVEAEESPKVESEAESPPAEDENLEKKIPEDNFQERINKLTKNWRDAQRALDDMERENRELQDRLANIPDNEEPLKTLEDFDFDDNKYRAYISKELSTRSEKAAERAVQKALQGLKAPKDTGFQQREAVFAKSVKDYHDTVYDQSAMISKAMADVGKVMEEGPQVLYYLAKNPDVAMDMYEASPAVVGMRMQKIASELNAKPKTVSDAPPPQPKKLGSGEPGGKVATTDPKSDELSDDEWFRREEARLAKRRG